MLIHNTIMQLPRDSRLTLALLHDFIRLASLAQPYLTFHQKPSMAPIVLPTAITNILSGALECNAELVETLWSVLKDEVWVLFGVVASGTEIKTYNEFALAQGDLNISVSLGMTPLTMVHQQCIIISSLRLVFALIQAASTSARATTI